MATLALTAYFTYNGEPKTGLSPTVTVWDISDSSVVVAGEAMSEVAGGWYKFEWPSFDLTKDYVARADGGSGQPAGERYAPIDMSGAALSGKIDAIDTDVLGRVVEGAMTVKQVLATLLSKAAGKGEGGGTGVLKYYNQAGDVVRITYNVSDDFGNRSTDIDVSDL